MPADLRKVVTTEKVVETRQTRTGYNLTTRYRLTLDCGHKVQKDRDQAKAKCPKGCA